MPGAESLYAFVFTDRPFPPVLRLGPRFSWTIGMRTALDALAEMAEEEGDAESSDRYRAESAALPPR